MLHWYSYFEKKKKCKRDNYCETKGVNDKIQNLFKTSKNSNIPSTLLYND